MIIQNLDYIENVQNNCIQGGATGLSIANVATAGVGPAGAIFNVLAAGLAIDVLDDSGNILGLPPGIYTDTAFGAVLGAGFGGLGFGGSASTLALTI